MRKLKLTISSMMSVLLFFAIGVDFAYYPKYFLVRDILLLILMFYCFLNIKVIFGERYRMMSFYVTVFVLSVLLTSLINIQYTRNHINTMLIFCFSVMIAFFFMTIQAHYGRMQKVVRIFLILQTIVLLCNDYVLVTHPDLAIQRGYMYLIGNKFTVTYAHLAWVTYYFTWIYLKKEKAALFSNIMGIGFLLYSGYIIWMVDCSSGLLAVVIMTGLILLIMNNQLVVGTLTHLLIILSISTAFVVINGFFLSIPIVQTIVRDVLGHTLTLSNRIYIYQQLSGILHGHWLIGFGFGTSYELGMSLGKFPNTQNGVMEWVWQCGLVGTALLFCVIVSAMKRIRRKKSIYVVSSFLITLGFLASVEITLNLLFMIMLAIVNALSLPKCNETEEEIEWKNP